MNETRTFDAPGNSAPVLSRPVTYDDLSLMPDDGSRREVIGGELIVNPAPRRAHQEVSANLHWMLQQFLRASAAGRAYAHPVDLYIGPHDVVQPDLIAIRASRLDIYHAEGVVVEPPDIVVEIISPCSQRVDRVRKMALYARFGVPEYWVVDPEEQSIEVNVLEDGSYRAVQPEADSSIASRQFPGLQIDPAQVFAGV